MVEQGFVEAGLWAAVEAAALAMFERGSRRGIEAGLILADTKFEFGVDADGELLLIDEALTPDSSRWWIADTYDERLAAGAEPESLDKEVVRRALADAGYTGDGPIPQLPREVWAATSGALHRRLRAPHGNHVRPGRLPCGTTDQRRCRATGDHLT